MSSRISLSSFALYVIVALVIEPSLVPASNPKLTLSKFVASTTKSKSLLIVMPSFMSSVDTAISLFLLSFFGNTSRMMFLITVPSGIDENTPMFASVVNMLLKSNDSTLMTYPLPSKLEILVATGCQFDKVMSFIKM